MLILFYRRLIQLVSKVKLVHIVVCYGSFACVCVFALYVF